MIFLTTGTSFATGFAFFPLKKRNACQPVIITTATPNKIRAVRILISRFRRFARAARLAALLLSYSACSLLSVSFMNSIPYICFSVASLQFLIIISVFRTTLNLFFQIKKNFIKQRKIPPHKFLMRRYL